MKFLWLGVKIPSALTDVGMVRFTTTMAYDNLKMEAKLNKAWHPFSNKLSLKVGANFQIIPLEDTCKQTPNIHPYM